MLNHFIILFSMSYPFLSNHHSPEVLIKSWMIVTLSALLFPLNVSLVLNYYGNYLVTLFLGSFQLSLDVKPNLFSWKTFILPHPYWKAEETAYCSLNQLPIQVPSTDSGAFPGITPKYWYSPVGDLPTFLPYRVILISALMFFLLLFSLPIGTW